MSLEADDKLDLERLIDGELSFAEQREMLARLDVVPDGWRRLALGLLEDQAFRREFHRMDVEEPQPMPIASPAAPMPVAQATRRAPRMTMTAACLVCLAVGMQAEQIRGRWISPNPQFAATTSSAGLASVAESTANSENEAPADALSAVNAAGVLPSASMAQAEQKSAGESTPPARQTVKVVFADWPTPVEVPVVEVGDEELSPLLQWTALPEDVRHEWESEGYVIYENRKYVPIPLKDGRRGIAPVSEIVVEYIGANEYQ